MGETPENCGPLVAPHEKKPHFGVAFAVLTLENKGLRGYVSYAILIEQGTKQ